MDFAESTEYLYSLGNEVSAMKLGLDNIRKLLGALGNPQNKYLKVQVAGTNGKGSVCAFLDSICNTAGIRTGTFTSPHLVLITERIRINGRDINEEDFAKHADLVRNTAESLLEKGDLKYRPTFFEQITAIALVAFADANVELAILETGLGGRLDATTAANAEIAAITRIDLDHQEYLGEMIEEIAAEKAAIIRDDTKFVVIGEQRDEALSLIEDRVRTARFSGLQIRVGKTSLIKDAPLGLKGKHQYENASIAVAVAEELKSYFTISDADINGGLENARHPGRIEYQGRYLFDGAHNTGGAKALTAYLDEFEKRQITLVFGAMRGKDVAALTQLLFPRCARIVLTQPENSRALTYQDLLAVLPEDFKKQNVFICDRVSNAIDIAETVTPDDSIILVTGSLYLVGEVKKILQSQI